MSNDNKNKPRVDVSYKSSGKNDVKITVKSNGNSKVINAGVFSKSLANKIQNYNSNKN